MKQWDDDQYDNEDNVPLSEMIESNDVYANAPQEVQLSPSGHFD